MAAPPQPQPEPEPAAGGAGLEALEGLALDTVIAKAGARQAAALACASTRLRDAAGDDALWRRFCADDLALHAPLAPDGRALPSFKDAYKVWLESFGMYPLPLVRRVKIFWSSLKSWLSENFPEAHKTLNKGVSEAQIQSAEDDLGFKLPLPTKLLYRFCNGQLPLSEHHHENMRMAHLGIIGGYVFYDHLINVHLSPLEQIVEETKEFYREFYDQDDQLYVGTINLQDGEMLPCVPKSLIRPTNTDMPQDGLLLWLEEHLRRLQNGMIKIRMLKTSRYISLFPEASPSCTSAMTNGVKVRASAVFAPEHPESRRPGAKCLYAYSIRLSVPEACMLGGVYYSSCQLYSRHWIIRWRDRVVSDVNGEGVIGKYPLLTTGQEEFVYESCTPLPDSPGSVEGSFTFVPGKLSRPEGKPFEVTVAAFPLEIPEYIF
ncbi:Os11g0265200 [Oryza sativa Japonica Group]|uniref:Os11g0265200 protein n=1 Tax=Oryza sativa subsp. japonica TaxID=39947 RepID=Q0ITE4_ORYSJ|nr:Os11g0265200 [Oryza sativa Japonica Group]|eukprot:NP_001067658.2 Os11g0265200 [Oryza sativa Japonica Group]